MYLRPRGAPKPEVSLVSVEHSSNNSLSHPDLLPNAWRRAMCRTVLFLLQ